MKLGELLRSELPDYSVKLPSIDKALSFRPFLVKEEKTLLLVSEEGNELDVLRAIKNILENCFEDLDLSSISLGEAEYLFVKLRERSVGETLELVYGKGIRKKPIELDLRKIKVPKRTGNKKSKFNITENISVTLRELTLVDVIKNEINIWNSDQDDYIKMIASIIETVTLKEESLGSTDLSLAEKVDFIENMTEQQFTDLAEFLKNGPRLSHTVKVEQEEGEDAEIEINGLNDFFGLVSLI